MNTQHSPHGGGGHDSEPGAHIPHSHLGPHFHEQHRGSRITSHMPHGGNTQGHNPPVVTSNKPLTHGPGNVFHNPAHIHHHTGVHNPHHDSQYGHNHHTHNNPGTAAHNPSGFGPHHGQHTHGNGDASHAYYYWYGHHGPLHAGGPHYHAAAGKHIGSPHTATHYAGGTGGTAGTAGNAGAAGTGGTGGTGGAAGPGGAAAPAQPQGGTGKRGGAGGGGGIIVITDNSSLGSITTDTSAGLTADSDFNTASSGFVYLIQNT